MLKYILLIIFELLIYPLNAKASIIKQQSSYLNIKAIPEYTTISENSTTLNVLVEITPISNWHIYYQNPGDAGDKTELTSNDSPYFTLSTPLYSTPIKETYEDIITSYIYPKTFYLLQTINLKNLDKTSTININFNLSYSACHDECIKDNLFFDLIIPIAPKSTPNQKYITAFTLSEASFPTPISATSETQNSTLILNLSQNLPPHCPLPHFISNTPKSNILSNLPTTELISPNKLQITFDTKETPTSNGLILCPEHSYILTKDTSSHPSSKNSPTSSNLYWHILIAFIAGLILNLMPCVLPVLSLKTLHLIKSQLTPRPLSSISYMLGVISSFLTLAGIIYYTKTLGKSLGWGFQLQSINFNLFLLLLFFIIFLSLIDKIHLPQSFYNFINKIPNQYNFLTGFVAVIIATPCTGPFMGTALGYALVSNTLNYFTIFFFLGLGYALPYTLLELNPQFFTRYIPKTGIWMLKLKYFLSIPIGLTCLWLGWVIYGQLNLNTPKAEILWEPYSKQSVETALQNNTPVFINFTAKWCLICLLNDKTTLSTQKFKSLIKQKNIKLYKADFTNKDENILNTLKEYNRNSVPLYIYQKNIKTPPKILPQILTIKELQQIL